MSTSNASSAEIPWATFCMSTYKRPEMLEKQLRLLLNQSERHFEIVVSDNDPEASGKQVVARLHDDRIRYFANGQNIGMIASFNKSLERASTKFIIMVTDDDPVSNDMLSDFRLLISDHPGYPIYCACYRRNKAVGQVEVLDANNFAFQLLHPAYTTNFLWSSCILERETAMAIGGFPDYGSPHLADHAMLALCSKTNGGVMVNRMYSNLTTHDENFSKTNLQLYYTGCVRDFIT